jgi:hypothetical protein
MYKHNSELLQKAFDVNVKNEEYYPNCVYIDKDIDNEATAFLQNTINEANQIEIGHHLTTNNIINDSDDDNEIEMNVHPDNVQVLRYKIYEHLNVNVHMVDEIKKEYECMKRKCMMLLKETNENESGKKLNIVNMIKDFGKSIRPTKCVLVNNVFPYLNNNYCFVQIKFIYKVIYSHKILINIPFNVLYEWLYLLLIMLKLPLVDDQNAFLYKINKHIFNKNKTTLTTNDKIIAIIISEIFNQKINII